jgi:uncharacterized protein (DUF2267 family)
MEVRFRARDRERKGCVIDHGEFIEAIRGRAALSSSDEAEHIARVTLGALAEYLSDNEADHPATARIVQYFQHEQTSPSGEAFALEELVDNVTVSKTVGWEVNGAPE